MVKGVKNEVFEVDNLFNVNSVILLDCINSIKKSKNLKISDAGPPQ